jgi:WD40 repeat protein
MVLRHTFLKYKLICLYAVLIVLITIPVEAQIDERVYDNFRTFVSWSPDGITLAVRSEDSVQIIDVTSMEILNTFPVNFQATVSAWSPDGSMIAIPNETQVEIWQNPQNAQLSQRIHVVGDTIPGIINFIDWSPTGDYLAIAKARIHIWRVGTNGIPHNLTDFRDTVTGFEWSPDGTLFAASSCDGTVKVWDATDFTLMHTISAISDANQVPEEIFQAVLSISWDTAGHRLAIGLQDGSTRIITISVNKTNLLCRLGFYKQSDC